MRRLIAALAFCLGLSCGLPAHASVYTLINGATATQSTAGNSATNTIVQPQAILGGPLQNQAFVVWATGGNPSCTVQILGSNDGITWVNYGATIVASSAAGGSANVANSGTGIIPYAYFAAIVTAISGSGTKCFVSLSG